ncbi:MAG: DUF5103 domain-containing protein [Prevotellaceae bacterium]|nr:DUF5103 domain-containing protein [Prevotellaceae bacterium]
MKKIFCTIIIMLNFCLGISQIFRTQIFDSQIKTLQIGIDGLDFSLPVINLNGDAVLTVSFDELSHTAHTYYYRVLHCNYNWTQSQIISTEYISGFTQGNITDYALSVATLVNYTHYRVRLPNDEMQFKISGNYVVQIYEDDVNQPVAQACFSVAEPNAEISGRVRGNTDSELNGAVQQLDFEVDINNRRITDPQNEIKVTVRQNRRLDNQVIDLKPTFLNGSKLSFINNKNLIFEGGNEYHRLDISSLYTASYGLDYVNYDGKINNAYLASYYRPQIYIYEPDVNGKFLVHFQEAFYDVQTEADYVMVHFSFDSGEPFFDGNVYVGGDFNSNFIDDASRMKYVIEDGKYILTYLLKQGGYSYQYWFVPKNQQVASTRRTDGSFWQTQNEYTIYVYQRGWGERYDKLIGVKVIQ